ncbi:hypothetical protein JCM9957A_62280 [Kineosporia succinea]|uniref:PpGpp synthetase/RelA/SpoT-type nucleotidyltransferase/AcrR family transcriptional regulator n=2 Tax=Kineosporia succinea TaxID=84632 RepID=A0ABT9PA10_9ACTN|nr:hypothetical protein [Kineosporia succinea]MDP9829244.1 ppGpp synthetase/RelA/SpoT-type nucleotidyltransferase/AcrR family transcriptional regulator [Kineosporia succinea]
MGENPSDALVLAAERLFAEHGVQAVHEQHISEAAGHDVTAHFGSRDELVRAVVQRHARDIAHEREQLIKAVRDPLDLREWVHVEVSSVIVHLRALERPSWYARFRAQVPAATSPDLARSPDLTRSSDLAQSPDLVHQHIGRCLPHLSPDVLAQRRAMMQHLIDDAIMRHERLLAEDASAQPGWDQVAEQLTDTVTALWRAPAAPSASTGVMLLPQTPPQPNPQLLSFVRQMREDFTRFLMEYQFAVDEVLTKVSVLREEFLHLHRYNPIEHVNSRLKSPESILEKVARRGIHPSLPSIRENITDIAGVRITCSFIADTYRVLETLTSQDDVRLIQTKDYIANPKANGYKSLHAIIEIPVFLSTGPVPVIVELQIRTIAMDFWASLEHKIFYKYDREVPPHLVRELTEAAAAAEQLDRRMEQLHHEVHGVGQPTDRPEASIYDIDGALLQQLWHLAQQQPPPPGARELPGSSA